MLPRRRFSVHGVERGLPDAHSLHEYLGSASSARSARGDGVFDEHVEVEMEVELAVKPLAPGKKADESGVETLKGLFKGNGHLNP